MANITSWRTSTRTLGQGQCVEVGFGAKRVGVRDTKNRTAGYLAVPVGRWHEFLASVKVGTFDW